MTWERCPLEIKQPTPDDVLPAEPASARSFRVRAPSRLHFGLLAFGEPSERQFGGVGVMIRDPGLLLEWNQADAFGVSGQHDERAWQAAREWSSFYDCPLPAAHIRVVQAPPQHVGLGVGTQLALAVAAGLHACQRQPLPPAAQLASSVARGRRSAVGVYGFLEGGLIAERGKSAAESLSPMDCRLDLPPAWRVVLARWTGIDGLSGTAEQLAFAQLPPVPEEVTRRLTQEARYHLLPAAASGDFDAFSASVYRYGRQAGECFAALQGGPYNGPRLAQLVELLRSLGIEGVGQSSWGPTVYAFLPHADAAGSICAQLRRTWSERELDLLVTAIDNEGAAIWEGERAASS